MNISEVMTRNVDLVAPETGLAEAARMMRDDDVGFLLIGDHDRLVGTITDRDIVLYGVAEKKDVVTTSVKEAMSPKVLYLFEDQSVDDAADNMAENLVRRMPVLDRDKRLVGVVSLGDIAAKAHGDAAAKALQQIARA